jgi:hypothetical protein
MVVQLNNRFVLPCRIRYDVPENENRHFDIFHDGSDDKIYRMPGASRRPAFMGIWAVSNPGLNPFAALSRLEQ